MSETNTNDTWSDDLINGMAAILRARGFTRIATEIEPGIGATVRLTGYGTYHDATLFAAFEAALEDTVGVDVTT